MLKPTALLLVSSIAGCAASGCHTCPDLSFGPLQLRVDGELDERRGKVLFDIEPLGRSASGLRELDLIGEGIPRLDAGSYRVIARRAGHEIGRVDKLCTAGTLLGCDAEQASAGDQPVIELDPRAEQSALRLVSDGRCP